MSTVYVTQEVMVRQDDGSLARKFDLSTAEKYGEVRVMVPYGQNLHSSVPVVRQLNEQLRNITEHDFLLPIGDPAVMAAAAAIAFRNTNGRLKILKWDRRAGTYLAVPVDLSGAAL